MTIPDPYAALNLPHSATSLQIKTSYRQLARKFHPDTWSQPCFSEADKKEATLKFAEISNAYALLSDADEKAEYDRTYRLVGGYDNTTNNAGSRTTHNNNNPHRNGRPCHTAAPPPPPPPSSPQRTSTVHWASAIDPVTRRRYYYNKQTGKCSWELPTHTAAATGTTTKTNNNTHDDHDDFGYQEMHQDKDWQQGRQQHQQPQEQDSYYGRGIDSHQCESFVALVLCPPIGLIAMYHSFRADRCRRQGLYNEAFHHARQAPKYSCLAKVIGVGFWIYYYIVVVRENDIEWPDFDFDFGDWGDRRRKE